MADSSNPIMDVLEQAQSGALVSILASAANQDESHVRASLNQFTPVIAQRIAGLAKDEDAFEDLLDVLDEEEQVEYLNDPQEMLGYDALEDGEQILKLLWGSVERAHDDARRIGAPAGMDAEVHVRIMTLAAALTLAAMVQRNQQFHLRGEDRGKEDGGDEGLVGMLVSAVTAGIMQGIKQAMTRKRRRKRRRGGLLSSIFGPEPKRRKRSSSRRRTTRKRRSRRKRRPSLKDLLGELLDD